MQFIGLLPRRDFNFKEVSSNWADYPFVVCEGDAGNTTCHLADTLRSPNIMDMTKQHGPDKTVAYYQVPWRPFAELPSLSAMTVSPGSRRVSLCTLVWPLQWRCCASSG
jgi:hypothetical protein